MKFDKNFYIDNIKTIFYALIIAVLIRSIIIQPFYIPSSSMEPNLLIGDRLFVSKYSYGYSKHSFPFSPPLFKGRILKSKPERGDVVVFKTPSDNRTDYIKRLIGLPGDKIKFIDGDLHINDGKTYNSAYTKKYTFGDSDTFIVPNKHYFFLGDNRDCSKDSRFLSEVGYVHEDNLVGKAQFIFFSSDYRKGSIFKFWEWSDILRINRFFKKI